MEKLVNIQTELKAPKGQYNSFGKYNYRSLEDITEAIKPLLKKYNMTLVISDEIVLIGDRYYVKATATITDEESKESVTVSAFAREQESQSGMQSAQLTGATSSYARKYALNGLFALDDNKDADTDEYAHQTGRTSKGNSARGANKASKTTNRELLIRFAKANGIDLNAVNQKYGLIGADETRFAEVLTILKQDMSGEEAQ